ncbi:MAG: restriction endonuclease [Verrucomicrobiota bacterium]
MKQVLTYVGYFLFLALVSFLIWRFSFMIIWVLIAAIISFVGHPLVRFFDSIHIKKWSIPHSLSAGLALLCIILLFFGLLAGLSFWLGKRRQTLVDQQTSLESLRAVPWKEFEFLVAEAYRRQGYEVNFSLGKGADGGVDLVLRKSGRTSQVQCKQWNVFSVGAPVIREMFGLLTAEQADEAIIVTSGKFTSEAECFAQGKPIKLVDGPRLLGLVKQVQSLMPTSNNLTTAATEPDETPFCPACGKVMVPRTARRGINAGNKFWGCPDYPGCKSTRQM